MFLFTVQGLAHRATLVFVLLAPAIISSSQPFNVTVDDQKGPVPKVGEEIQYSKGWDNSGFAALGWHRDDPQAMGLETAINGTWKRSVYTPSQSSDPPTATLKFNGTAVYVTCMLTDVTKDGTRANSDMFFVLDDSPPINFTQPALLSKPASNKTVFQKEGLSSDKEHTIIVRNGQKGSGPDATVILLDAIVYTYANAENGTESAPSPDPSRGNVNPTAGIPISPIENRPNTGDTATTSPSSSDIVSITAIQATSENTDHSRSPQTSLTRSLLPSTTTPTPSPTPISPGPKSNIVAIIAGVCGAIAGLFAAFLAFWARRRRRGQPLGSAGFDRLRFVRWRSQHSSKASTVAKYYSADMESIRSSSSNSSVTSLYLLPTPETTYDGPSHNREPRY